MNDIPSTARTARENLSKGLNALQSDPNVPPALLDIAGTIAQAMGALMQIERSNGSALVPHAEVALTGARTALSALQQQPSTLPAVNAAMEAVASSLALVHALNKLASGGGQPAPQPQYAPPPQPQAQYAPPPQPQHAPPPQQQFAPQPQYAPPPQPQQAPPQPAYGAPPPQPQQQWGQPQQPSFPQPQAAADPFAAPQRSPLAGTAVAAPGQAPIHSKNPPAPPMQGDMPIVSADLGAHSATNFYKGLSGNDIIDHGGLFIATYMIPKVGTPVRLKVSLPGGYEFEANAVVKWRREMSEGGEPGFGAQFTQISPEARQLVYRYVRNREPLFHDDL